MVYLMYMNRFIDCRGVYTLQAIISTLQTMTALTGVGRPELWKSL